MQQKNNPRNHTKGEFHSGAFAGILQQLTGAELKCAQNHPSQGPENCVITAADSVVPCHNLTKELLRHARMKAALQAESRGPASLPP